jgi:SAM-dependent methyltransferase
VVPWPRPPPELRAAVEDGFLAPGARVLDIGCGDGENAVFLARQGLRVLGIDFAEGAAARARERARAEGCADRAEIHRTSARPRARLRYAQFATRDVCRDALGEAEFTALLDCGCFHAIGPSDALRYARRVATAAAPGARFLLLAPVFRPGVDTHDPRAHAEGVLARAGEALGPSFDVVRAVLPPAGPATDALRLEVRLVRRAAATAPVALSAAARSGYT